MLNVHPVRSWLLERFFSSQPARSKKDPAKGRSARPKLETLEGRLAPGDLLNLSLLGSAFAGGAAGAVTQTTSGSSGTSAQDTTTQKTFTTAATTTSSVVVEGTAATRQQTPAAGSSSPTSDFGDLAASGSGYAAFVTNTSSDPAGALGAAADGASGVSAGDTYKTGEGQTTSSSGSAPSRRTPSSGAGGQTGRSTSAARPNVLRDVRSRSGFSVLNKDTNDKRPLVIGAGGRGQRFDVWVDGRRLGRVTANARGTWAFRWNRNLADGQHTFTVTRAGQRAVIGTGRTVVDTRPPVVTLAAPAYVTRNQPAIVKVTATDARFTGNRVALLDIDLNNDGRFNRPGEMSFRQVTLNTPIDLSGLRSGTYRLRARVGDPAGNVGMNKVALMQVDHNAGYIGSQPLLDLVNISKGSGGGGEGGSGGGSKWSWSVSGKAPDELYQIDDNGRVRINVRYTLPRYAAAFKQALQGLGGEVTNHDPASNLYVAWLPHFNIMGLESLPHFNAAVPVPKATLRIGSVTSEGDAVIRANTFRAQQNVNGAGVKVGVISDSVDQVAGGLADSVASGDLPNNVQVLADGPNGSTDEGRAMLEIVHDLAPGSPLAFSTHGGSEVAFANAILALRNAGAKVITDDIGYFSSPMFSGGRMGRAADQVAASGVFYTSAAGNDGSKGWRGAWSPINATIDGTAGTWQRFGGGALQNFTLAANDVVSVKFNWDAAYLEGGAPGLFQVPNNLDVYIIRRDNGQIVANSNTNNINTDEAYETLSFTNNTGQTAFAFAFRLVAGPAPRRLAWMDLGSDPSFNPGTVGPTIYGQPLAAGAFAAGAVPSDAPTSAEPFSSRGGPLEIFSNNAGVRFTTPQIRYKPDASAPDKVTTSFFPSSGNPVFFGTSAATPHVAGAAALLLQQSRASSAAVFNHLKVTARDLAPAGRDPLTGTGLIQLTPLTGGGISLDLGLEPGALEANETSDKAWNLGTITGQFRRSAGLQVGQWLGLPDYDWYRFRAGRTARVTVTQSSSSLQLHVYRRLPNGLLTLIRNGSRVTAGTMVYFVIKGRQIAPAKFSRAVYSMTVRLS